MAATGTSTPADKSTVREPFPIFKLAHRYMLYDVDVVTHVRTQHHILGVLVGTLPQANQQNVFLGLPLELQPEEARLLVEKGAAYIADDTADHKRDFLGQGGASLSAGERRAYQAALRKQGQGVAREAETARVQKKIAALDKKGLLTPATAGTENWNDLPDDMYTPGPRKRVVRKTSRLTPGAVTPAAGAGTGFFDGNGDAATQEGQDPDTSLFASPSPPPPAHDDDSHHAPAAAVSQALLAGDPDEPRPYGVTPATSYFAGRSPLPMNNGTLPAVPPSYPLFRHLHNNGYFMMPGIRFGCRYSAYPGDPLRYHAHFMANGMGWDDEFDLLEMVVAGGRLATGVKKGFLVGGEVPGNLKQDAEVRAFCIEWAGM